MNIEDILNQQGTEFRVSKPELSQIEHSAQEAPADCEVVLIDFEKKDNLYTKLYKEIKEFIDSRRDKKVVFLHRNVDAVGFLDYKDASDVLMAAAHHMGLSKAEGLPHKFVTAYSTRLLRNLFDVDFELNLAPAYFDDHFKADTPLTKTEKHNNEVYQEMIKKLKKIVAPRPDSPVVVNLVGDNTSGRTTYLKILSSRVYEHGSSVSDLFNAKDLNSRVTGGIINTPNGKKEGMSFSQVYTLLTGGRGEILNDVILIDNANILTQFIHGELASTRKGDGIYPVLLYASAKPLPENFGVVAHKIELKPMRSSQDQL